MRPPPIPAFPKVIPYIPSNSPKQKQLITRCSSSEPTSLRVTMRKRPAIRGRTDVITIIYKENRRLIWEKMRRMRLISSCPSSLPPSSGRPFGLEMRFFLRAGGATMKRRPVAFLRARSEPRAKKRTNGTHCAITRCCCSNFGRMWRVSPNRVPLLFPCRP